jgi:hypothetical protein
MISSLDRRGIDQVRTSAAVNRKQNLIQRDLLF